jgi:hypothetical protein
MFYLVQPPNSPAPMVPNDPKEVPISEKWRRRASECRKAAEKFQHVESRVRMMRAAEEFDRLAAGAAEQELAPTKVTPST